MNTQFLRDAAERIVSTFVMGFVGSVSFAALYVAVTSHDWHGAAIVLHAGAVGGLAAVGSLAKALIAKRKSGTISPASFVKGRAAAKPDENAATNRAILAELKSLHHTLADGPRRKTTARRSAH